jgi:transcriptional regulator GlxA family with amidase domain
MHSTGFCVLWPVSDFCGFWISQSVDCLRSPRNFGDTPALFAERARADAARCELEQTTLPVETIAEECGFGNTERMQRTFQRLFDVSPHDYRARFRSTLLT